MLHAKKASAYLATSWKGPKQIWYNGVFILVLDVVTPQLSGVTDLHPRKKTLGAAQATVRFSWTARCHPRMSFGAQRESSPSTYTVWIRLAWPSLGPDGCLGKLLQGENFLHPATETQLRVLPLL